MARIADIGLAVLQWLIGAWGVFLIVSALHYYQIEAAYFADVLP